MHSKHPKNEPRREVAPAARGGKHVQLAKCSSCPVTSVQRQLQKLEITKTNEMAISGASSSAGSSSGSSSTAGRTRSCSWRPKQAQQAQRAKEPQPPACCHPQCAGCAGAERRSAAGAAGDATLATRPRHHHHHQECQRKDRGQQGHGRGHGAARGLASSSSTSSTASTSPASTSEDESHAGDGGAGGLQRRLDGHGQPLSQPAHPYRQDVEHRGRSFSVDQMWRIERENQDLLRRLRACRRATPPSAPAPIRITASSAINRSARQRQIDRENMIIRRRLQDIEQSSSTLGTLGAGAKLSGGSGGGLRRGSGPGGRARDPWGRGVGGVVGTPEAASCSRTRAQAGAAKAAKVKGKGQSTAPQRSGPHGRA